MMAFFRKLAKHINRSRMGGCRLIHILLLLLMLSIHRTTSEMLTPCGSVDYDERIDDDTSGRWFKWGQLYSYCKHSYSNKAINSSITSAPDFGCNKNSECAQCTTVCKAKDKSLPCDKMCTNEPCLDGCRFYDYLFNDTGNFDVDKRNLPNLTHAVIHATPTNENVSYSWTGVKYDGDKTIPILYLIVLKQNNTFPKHILGLLETPSYTATMGDFCSRAYGRKYEEQDLQFSLIVYPLNFNGPSDAKESEDKKIMLVSKYTNPTKVPPLQGITIEPGSPFFAKRSDHADIVWHLKFPKVTDRRSIGVAYICELSCASGKQDMDLNNCGNNVLFLHNYHQTSERNERLVVPICNTVTDILSSCTIEVKASVKYGGCFLSDPFTKLINYANCSTVANYSNACPYVRPTPPVKIDTYVEDVTFDVDSACTYVKDLCRDNSSVIQYCNYCRNATFTVKVDWEPYQKYPADFYQVRYRMENQKNYVIPKGEILPKQNTSYVIKAALAKGYSQLKLCVQIFVKTNHSNSQIMSLFNKKYEQKVLLQVDDPIRIKHKRRGPPQGSPKMVITVIAVVVVLAVIGVCIKVYHNRLQRRKKELYLQNGGVYKKDAQSETAVIPDEWEIYPESIDVKKKLGEGAFGMVFSARIDMGLVSKSKFAKHCGGVSLMNEKSKLVAVKFLKEGASDEESNDFRDEIALMKGIGYHSNIVNMIGCSTIKQPLCLIVEYMQNGDLLNFLRKKRSKEPNDQSIDPTQSAISINDIMSFAWQIACGMEYLASKNMVHRDLAARNVLVGSDNKVKLSDFGLSREVRNEQVYVSRAKRRIPVKWMSIEAIYDKLFTEKSDVWAYGVTLFEIVTLGGAPYPLISNYELGQLLQSGYRMERPDNCSEEMHDIMRHCWNEIPARRPTFTELKEHLEKIMEKGAHYFSFDIDYSKPYYNVPSFHSIPSDDENETSVFTAGNVERPAQVKVVETVKIPMGESLQEKLDPPDGSVPARYISPHSIKSITDVERSASFDNHSFHFHE